jgi:hypothetical protein
MLMAGDNLAMIILWYVVWESVNMHESGTLYCQHFAMVCHI